MGHMAHSSRWSKCRAGADGLAPVAAFLVCLVLIILYLFYRAFLSPSKVSTFMNVQGVSPADACVPVLSRPLWQHRLPPRLPRYARPLLRHGHVQRANLARLQVRSADEPCTTAVQYLPQHSQSSLALLPLLPLSPRPHHNDPPGPLLESFGTSLSTSVVELVPLVHLDAIIKRGSISPTRLARPSGSTTPSTRVESPRRAHLQHTRQSDVPGRIRAVQRGMGATEGRGGGGVEVGEYHKLDRRAQGGVKSWER